MIVRLVVFAAAILPLPLWMKILLIGGALGAFWWLALSLAVSHWIYDRSPLNRWTWLPPCFSTTPHHIINIHSGFDESSASITALFPAADRVIFDFYDPIKAPEPSIERARRICPPSVPAAKIDPHQWPSASQSAANTPAEGTAAAW